MPDDLFEDDVAGEGSTEQATPADPHRSSWRPFARPERLPEVDSTNTELMRRAAAGAPEGTVLVAARQGAGRGRLGRRWVGHPGGSLLCSLLFRPSWPAEHWHLAPLVVALSAAEASSSSAGVECACKWPNDLLAGPAQRKVAGVLSEAGRDGALVVGIGLNVNWPPGFPPEGDPDAAALAASATSLDRVAGSPVDLEALTAAFLAGVARRWERLDPGARRPSAEASALRDDYRRRCATLGRLVRVELPAETLLGRAVDLDERGRLVVETPSGARPVDSGDVVHVRTGGAGGAG